MSLNIIANLNETKCLHLLTRCKVMINLKTRIDYLVAIQQMAKKHFYLQH